jgi:hypothetical protein
VLSERRAASHDRDARGYSRSVARERESEGPLELVIQDVFRIKDRRIIVSCRRRSGDLRELSVGLKISMTRPDGEAATSSIRGLEFQTPPPPPDVVSFLLPEGTDPLFLVPGAVIRAHRQG